MNTSSLLIEIFIEELPFSAISKEIRNILPMFNKILELYRINASCEFFWTPRRLIISSKNIDLKQKDIIKEFFGPPLNIAYDNDKNLTNAARSFLKKLYINQDELQTAMKDNKECLYYTKKEIGIETKKLLEDIIDEWLESLNFGKNMQWGRVESSFIRPIRNIFVLLDSEFIRTPKLEWKYQFVQHNAIIPHRSQINKMKAHNAITSAESYFAFLRNNGVIYSQDSRRNIILDQICALEKKHNVKVELDSSLLAEIVAITEFPTALYGKFDERFLELPKEVIITSMKINQKYFAIYNATSNSSLDSTLHNGFIVVCNTLDSSAFSDVVNGNERVLRARLEDALFFYHNDMQHFVQDSTDIRLKHIEFIQDSGSMFDKVEREKALAIAIINHNKAQNPTLYTMLETIKSCITISKNDLVSEMVGEFGELQGIMSSYYANNTNLKPILKEQYLPLQEDTNLPSRLDSAVVAISHKLDTILSLFAINKIPSGSKDPFGLRRNANGIIKIVHRFGIRFVLDEILDVLRPHYKQINKDVILQFFYERIEGVLGVNQSIVNAAIKSKERDLSLLCLQIEALNSIVTSNAKDELKPLFKRVANILIDTTTQDIDKSLFIAPQEIALFKALQDFRKLHIDSPKERIEKLLGLKEVLQHFFDNVMVLVDDKRIKDNRILLIKGVYEEFLKVGDIREISF